MFGGFGSPGNPQAQAPNEVISKWNVSSVTNMESVQYGNAGWGCDATPTKSSFAIQARQVPSFGPGGFGSSNNSGNNSFPAPLNYFASQMPMLSNDDLPPSLHALNDLERMALWRFKQGWSTTPAKFHSALNRLIDDRANNIVNALLTALLEHINIPFGTATDVRTLASDGISPV